MPVAIVLLSGGLDSSTVLAMAKERGLEVVALTFDYGQKHKRELNSARKVALHFGVREHVIVPLDLVKHPRSALTRESIQMHV